MRTLFTIPTIAEKSKRHTCLDHQLGLEKSGRKDVCTVNPALTKTAIWSSK
jgi:hypothetical protein